VRKDRISYERHHDDEIVDEINIRIVPRYKMSDLSGDEWRVSAHVEFKRKGRVILEKVCLDLKIAMAFLYYWYTMAGEEGLFAQTEEDEAYCFQPGCREKAISEYRLKQRFCSSCGEVRPEFGESRRRFCANHLIRGDCGLEDADSNYEVMAGPGPEGQIWSGQKISESQVVIVKPDEQWNI